MALVNCTRCEQRCDKSYQLPECGHIFCKKCLNENSDDTNYFSCPRCGRKFKKPDIPVSKWIKQFRMYKTATFFTNDSDTLTQGDTETGSDYVHVPSKKSMMTSKTRKVKSSTFYTISNSQEPGFQETDTGSESVRFREASRIKYRSLHRAGMRLSKYSFEKAFESKISSDSKECVYFGGDTIHNGNLLLSDWMNFSVKMFDSSGQFVCKIKVRILFFKIDVLI